MATDPFVGRWRVLGDPQPLGEGAGHVLTIALAGDGGYTIVCDHHCQTRTGSRGRTSEEIEGDGFTIRHLLAAKRIVCRPSKGGNTGSWTAEDASGPAW